MDTIIFASFFLFLKVMLLKVFSLFIFFIFFIFQPEMLLVTLFHMIFNSSSHLNATNLLTFMASLMPINAMLLMLSLISNPCYGEEQSSLILFVGWEHIFNTRSKDVSCILSRSLNVKI